MKKQKLISIILSVTIMLASTLTAFAAGKVYVHIDKVFNGNNEPLMEDMYCAEDVAQVLNLIGLVNGTGVKEDGTPEFSLEKVLNRQEAVTMVLKLLGMDKIAVEENNKCPFNDVDAWAQPYIAYAYKIGMVNGYNETQFGGKDELNAQQYATLMMKALGYNNANGDFDYATVLDTLKAMRGTYYTSNPEVFNRGEMFKMTANTLMINTKNEGKPLIEVLGKGFVTDVVFQLDRKYEYSYFAYFKTIEGTPLSNLPEESTYYWCQTDDAIYNRDHTYLNMTDDVLERFNQYKDDAKFLPACSLYSSTENPEKSMGHMFASNDEMKKRQQDISITVGSLDEIYYVAIIPAIYYRIISQDIGASFSYPALVLDVNSK